MKDKGRIVITIVFFCLLFSMSIGYATYISKTNINGNATFYKNGKITISSAVLTDYENLQNPINPII